jgi:hypothetical protein
VSNEVRVQTEEVSGNEQAIYLFSARWEARSANIGGGYVQAHERAEREGKVDHSLEKCPELNRPKVIREWAPETGWRDIRVSWFGAQK